MWQTVLVTGIHTLQGGTPMNENRVITTNENEMTIGRWGRDWQ